MDKKAIKALIENNPGPFVSRAFYNKKGDCIQQFFVDEFPMADYINPWLTLYRSPQTKKVIGLKIKCVNAIIDLVHKALDKTFEHDGVKEIVKKGNISKDMFFAGHHVAHDAAGNVTKISLGLVFALMPRNMFELESYQIPEVLEVERKVKDEQVELCGASV